MEKVNYIGILHPHFRVKSGVDSTLDDGDIEKDAFLCALHSDSLFSRLPHLISSNHHTMLSVISLKHQHWHWEWLNNSPTPLTGP